MRLEPTVPALWSVVSADEIKLICACFYLGGFLKEKTVSCLLILCRITLGLKYLWLQK